MQKVKFEAYQHHEKKDMRNLLARKCSALHKLSFDARKIDKAFQPRCLIDFELGQKHFGSRRVAPYTRAKI